jgi:ribosomal protein S27AE
MSIFFELELDGTQKEWQLEEAECPKCHGSCEHHVPLTPETPPRITCGRCGFEEGFNPLEALCVAG